MNISRTEAPVKDDQISQKFIAIPDFPAFSIDNYVVNNLNFTFSTHFSCSRRAINNSILNALSEKYELRHKIGFTDEVGEELTDTWLIFDKFAIKSLATGGLFCVYAGKLSDIEVLLPLIKQELAKDTIDTSLYMFDGDRFVLRATSTSSHYKPLYKNLFPDIDLDVLCKEYAASPNSILLLYGPPGVGKTSFVRYIFQKNLFKNIYTISSTLLATNPNILSRIFNEDNDTMSSKLILLDDVDHLLASRDKADLDISSMLSSFLSYTDSINRPPKVILTTNANITELDSALIRAGRCFDFIQLYPMDIDYARNLWVNEFNLSVDIFDNCFKDNKVFQSNFISKIEELTASPRLYYKNKKDAIGIAEKLDALGISIRKYQ